MRWQGRSAFVRGLLDRSQSKNQRQEGQLRSQESRLRGLLGAKHLIGSQETWEVIWGQWLLEETRRSQNPKGKPEGDSGQLL